MPALEDRLAVLRGLPRDARATILSETLPYASLDELGPLAQEAVATGEPYALAGVLRCSAQLGQDAVQYLGRRTSQLLPAIRIVLTDGGSRTVEQTIRMVGALADPVLLGPVVARLGSNEPEIATAAEEAVLQVTYAVVGPHGRWQSGPEKHAALDQALAEAARRYRRHRSRPVLMAIALATHRLGPHLEAVLADEEDPVVLALRSVPDQIDEPLVRRNLLAWLGGGPLDRPSARRLGLIEGAEAFDDLLARRHLMLIPARRRALRQVDRPIRCAPDAATTVRLSADAQAALPSYMCRVGMPRAALLPRLAALHALPEPRARIGALIELMGRPSEMARSVAEGFVEDELPSIAHVAAVHTNGPDRSVLHERFEASPHRIVAEIGTRGLARADANAFGARWSRLSAADRIVAARQLRERNLSALVTVLGELIADDDVVRKREVITLARRLRLVDRLLPAVAVEVKSDDVKLASTALGALRVARSDGANAKLRRAAIRFGLHHRDARVRANAIEAMSDDDRLDAEAHIATLAYSDENRPRGNAVLSMCDEGAGVPALRVMLRDTRPLHRVSAIWVASRRRVRGVGDLLTSIVRDDPTEAIRNRATEALRLIEHPMQVQT